MNLSTFPWRCLFVLVAVGLQIGVPADAKAQDETAAACIPMERGYVRSGAGAVCRVGLPGTAASAGIPPEWVCEASSTAMNAEEMVNVLSCIPADGGSPVSLQKVLRERAADSLDGFLRKLHSQYAEFPAENVLMQPREVTVSGRRALEAAFKGSATAHLAGGGHAPMEMLHHTIIFEDASVFYECELVTTPKQYSETLRKTLQAFCASVRFDGTIPPAGITSHG